MLSRIAARPRPLRIHNMDDKGKKKATKAIKQSSVASFLTRPAIATTSIKKVTLLTPVEKATLWGEIFEYPEIRSPLEVWIVAKNRIEENGTLSFIQRMLYKREIVRELAKFRNIILALEDFDSSHLSDTQKGILAQRILNQLATSEVAKRLRVKHFPASESAGITCDALLSWLRNEDLSIDMHTIQASVIQNRAVSETYCSVDSQGYWIVEGIMYEGLQNIGQTLRPDRKWTGLSEGWEAEESREPGVLYALWKEESVLLGTTLPAEYTHALSIDMKTLIEEKKEQFEGLAPIDDSLLIHFNGDSFASGTGLEGSNHESILGYLQKYLEKYPGPVSEKQQEIIRVAQELICDLYMPFAAGTVKEIAAELHARAEGVAQVIAKRIENRMTTLIGGGWRGKFSGHAMDYEILPQEEGKVTFRIYNTGAGIDRHEGYTLDEQAKHLCFYEIVDIDRENVLSPVFIKAMLEPFLFPKHPVTDFQHISYQEMMYGPADIYPVFQRLLGGKRSKPSYEMEELMGPQRSGTCSWKCLSAWLRRYMSRKDYKLFKHRYRQDTILHYLNCHPHLLDKEAFLAHDLQQSVIAIHLLKACIEKFARESLKLFQDKLINDEQLVSVKQIASGVAKLIEERLQESSNHPDRISTTLSIPSVTAHADLTEIPLITARGPGCVLSFDGLTSVRLNPASVFHSSFDPETLAVDLREIYTKVKLAFEQGFVHDCEKYLDTLFQTLPTPSYDVDFWDAVSEIPVAIKTLHKISKIRFKICFYTADRNNVNPMGIFCVMKAYAITGKLAYLSGLDHTDGNEGIDLHFSYRPGDDFMTEQPWLRFSTPVLEKEFRQCLQFVREDCPFKPPKSQVFSNFLFECIRLCPVYIRDSETEGRLKDGYSGISIGQTRSSQDNVSLPLDYIKNKLNNNPDFRKKIQNEIIRSDDPDCDVSAIPKEDPKRVSIPLHQMIATAYASEELLPISYVSIRYLQWAIQTLIYGVIRKSQKYPFSPDLFDFKTIVSRIRSDGSNVETELSGVDSSIFEEFPELKRILPVAFQGVKMTAFRDNFGLYEKEEMRVLSDWAMQLAPREINQLMAEDFKDFKSKYGEEKILCIQMGRIPEEQFRQLASLFLTLPHKMQKALDYFTENKGVLSDPDYQKFFKILLLNLHELEVALQKSPITLIKLCRLLREGLQKAKDIGNIQEAVFYLSSLRTIQKAISEAPSGDLSAIAVASELPDSLEELKSLTAWTSLDADDQCLIAWQRLAYFNEKEGELLPEEAATLLECWIRLRSHPLRATFQDPHVRYEAETAFFIFRDQLQGLLKGENGDHILSHVASKLRRQLQESKRWVTVGDDASYLFQSEDGILIDIGEGYLYENFGYKIPLPEFVKHASWIQRLVGGASEGVQTEIGKYFIKKEDGTELLIEIVTKGTQKQILLHKRFPELFGDTWFTFTEKERFDNKIPSKIFSETCDIWVGAADPMTCLFSSKKTGQIEAYAIVVTDVSNGNPTMMSPIFKPGEPSFHLAPFQEEVPLFHLLSQFETPECIHVWCDKNREIQTIELPRYGLEFEVKKHGREVLAFSKQYPGFFLSQHQRLSSFRSVSHYLVIENAKGKKKVLLPKIEALKLSGGTLLKKKIRMNTKLSSVMENEFFTYTFNSTTQTLHSRSRETNLYLAYSYLLDRNYHEVKNILEKRVAIPQPFTQDEIGTLLMIIDAGASTQDHFPQATALQLKAAALMMHNIATYRGHPLTTGEFLTLFLSVLGTYATYLQTLPNTTSFQLQPEEEKYFFSSLQLHEYLRHLAENESEDTVALAKKMKGIAGINERIQNRYRTLFQEESERVFSAIPVFEVELEEFPEECYLRCFDSLQKEQAYKPILNSRPGDAFINSFSHHYLVARRGGGSEFDQVKQVLASVHGDPDASIQALRMILEQVILNPERFPTVDTYQQAMKGHNFDQIRKLFYDIFAEARAAYKESIAFDKDFATPAIRREVLPPEKRSASKVTIRSGTVVFTAPPVYIPPGYEMKSFIKKMVRRGGKEGESPESIHLLKELLSQDTEGLDRVEKGAFHTLYEDVEAYEALLKGRKVKYKLQKDLSDPAINDEMQKVISGQSSVLSCSVEREKEAVLTLAKIKEHDVLKKVEIFGTVREAITFDDLVIAFGKGDITTILSKNPDLLQEEIHAIMTRVARVLIETTRIQQLDRASTKLQELRGVEMTDFGTKQVKKQLIQNLGKELFAERAYEVAEHPEFLVFEHYARIMIRPEQVEKLKELMATGKKGVIQQLIMGAGKSSVLLPLMSLVRADGENIAIAVVPDPLYQTVCDNLHETLTNAFDQYIETIEFDRNTRFTLERLETINKVLDKVRIGRKCLLAKDKTLHCLYLKYLESLAIFTRGHPEEIIGLESKIHLMREILGKMKRSGDILIDEADLILNCRHEVNFTIGEEAGLQQERLQLVSNLYHMLREDPDITSIISFEFSTRPAAPTAKPFSLELYRSKVLPLLAQKIIKSTLSFTPPEKQIAILEYMKTSPKELRTWSNERKTEIEKTLLSFDEKKRHLIALGREELQNILPLTLSRTCHVHYGIAGSLVGGLAIPYLASHTPNFGSEFGNPYEVVNYTIQSYLISGISEKVVGHVIKQLQEQAIQEMGPRGEVPFKETSVYPLFVTLTGGDERFHLFKLDENHIRQFTKKINSTSELQQQFLISHILTKIEVYEEKLNSNPQNFVSLFKKAQGFTGTLWNGDTFHKDLILRHDPGTDSKTLEILMTHSKGECQILPTTETKEALLEALLASTEGVDAILDTGGLMREHADNESVARQILKSAVGKERDPPMDGVVFYNTNNQLMILERGQSHPILIENSTLHISRRCTFYDQKHTTGADIKQKLTAIGVVTIGKNTFVRDLLQTVWRLRGLDQGQKVAFVISAEIKKIMQHTLGLDEGIPIDISHLIRFTTINQARQQSKDNSMSFRQKLYNLAQEKVYQIFLDQTLSIEQLREVFSAARSLFVSELGDRPYDQYGALTSLEGTEKVIKAETQAFLASLEAICSRSPILKERVDLLAIRDSINEIIDLEKLPEWLVLSGETSDLQVEKELEREQEVEKEKEKETIEETELMSKLADARFETDIEDYFTPRTFSLEKPDESVFSIMQEIDRMRIEVNQFIEGLCLSHLEKRCIESNYHYLRSLIHYRCKSKMTPHEQWWADVLYKHFRWIFQDDNTEIPKDKVEEMFQGMLQKGMDRVSALNVARGKAFVHKILLDQVISQDSESFEYAELFEDTSIILSPNVLTSFTRKPFLRVFSHDQKPFDHIFVRISKETGEIETIVVDQNEAGDIKESLSERKDKGLYRTCLYLPNAGVVQQGSELITDEELAANPAFMLGIIKLKIFNGETYFTQSERNLLREWCKNSGITKKLQSFIKEKVLPYHQKASKLYKTSVLKRVLEGKDKRTGSGAASSSS